jgi:hypothetical protein
MSDSNVLQRIERAFDEPFTADGALLRDLLNDNGYSYDIDDDDEVFNDIYNRGGDAVFCRDDNEDFENFWANISAQMNFTLLDAFKKSARSGSVGKARILPLPDTKLTPAPTA